MGQNSLPLQKYQYTLRIVFFSLAFYLSTKSESIWHKEGLNEDLGLKELPPYTKEKPAFLYDNPF